MIFSKLAKSAVTIQRAREIDTKTESLETKRKR